MDPLTLLTLAITLAETLIPKVVKMAAAGEITAEEQRAVLDRFTRLRAQIDAGFTGPEWEKPGTLSTRLALLERLAALNSPK